MKNPRVFVRTDDGNVIAEVRVFTLNKKVSFRTLNFFI